MENREFYLQDDGIAIHCKLDLPHKAAAHAESIPAAPRLSGSKGAGTGHAEAEPSEKRQTAKKLPLLILIHGFTGHMEEDHILAVMRAANEAGFAVLRAEMYGHGLTGGAFRDHTLFKWISNALTVIDYARKLDFATDLCLAGHSQGGLLTMLVAAMERDRLRAILPLSPATVIPDGARRGELLGMPFDPDHIPEEMPTDKEGLVLGDNYIRAAQMIDVDAAIRRFAGPVLLVHGSGDESVPVQCSIDAAAKYADAKLVIIPDDTHCYDLHVDLVAEAVRDFLQAVSA